MKITDYRPVFFHNNALAHTTVRIADPGQSGWTLANVFRQGYYRVAYDMDTWDKLMEQLKTNYKVST